LRAGGGGTKHLADGERSVAHRTVSRAWRQNTQAVLKEKPVVLDGAQARAVARGLDAAKREGNYRVWRCAVLPTHVHLLMAPADDRSCGKAAGHLKARVTQTMRSERLHPFLDAECDITNPLWARRFRCRWVTERHWLAGALRYVGNNPVKAGLPRQRWWFEERCVLLEG
jgi:REP element-mobilizing transposase RayT